MQLMRAKIISILMALLMMVTSVGITVKVHSCLMTMVGKEKTACCCEPKQDVEANCCTEKESTPKPEKNCCTDVVKSVALSAEYATKVQALEHFSFAPVFCKLHFTNFNLAAIQSEILSTEIKQPPNLFDSNIIYFLQVIKV